MMRSTKKGRVLNLRKGFTLVELLVVMGIIVVLATTSVLVFKPLEYNRESRDTRRIGDVNTIENAIETALANNPNMSVGTVGTTVYVSIPDPTLTGNATSTCGGVTGIPALPSGWQYQCVSAANLMKTDGTGWMPINFSALPSGSPLTSLPIDPSNSAVNRSYYTYIPQGGMTAKIESVKMLAEVAAKDGGTDQTLYELGKNPNPIAVAVAPTISTNAAAAIAQTSATLSGTANPNGNTTSAWFRYSTANPGSCNDTFGAATGAQGVGAGSSAVAYAKAIAGLTVNTTYYYCAIGQNSGGLGYGSVQAFTTTSLPPTVATNAATAIAATTATLNSTVNPNGISTDGWFRYSTTNPGSCNDTFGTRLPGGTGSLVGSGSSGVVYTQNATGLSANTSYYYCGIAESTGGKVFGSVQSFATLGNLWAQLIGSGTVPDAKINQSAVLDSARSKIYIYGYGAATSFSARFNAYDIAANSWAQLTPSGSFPPGRFNHSSVWDGARDKMYVFAGYEYMVGYKNDLWSYNATPNSWTQLTPSGTAPAERSDHSAVWDAARSKMYVFGGWDQYGGKLNDLWSYDAAANSWTQLAPSGTAPTARRDSSTVWDATRSKMYVFGGLDNGGSRNDLWSYDAVANSWTQLSPSGTLPTGRWKAPAAWDAATSKMYVFDGGNSTTGTLNDFWVYDVVANSWTQLSPSGTIPPKRQEHSAVWDSSRNKMYSFGGQDGLWLADLWVYTP